MLIDSAAMWFDSLTPEIQNDWGQLKAAFLARYTTPKFMKYKRANELFNFKQDTKSVDDYCAHLQRLAKEVGANDEILHFAVLNGLRPDINKKPS